MRVCSDIIADDDITPIGKIAMPALTIRNIDAGMKEQLRIRAARHGHSMEAELRQILKDALASEKAREQEPNLAEAIRRRFLPLGGVDDLEAHPPVPVSDPPTFDR
jgi:plasmid stability protein